MANQPSRTGSYCNSVTAHALRALKLQHVLLGGLMSIIALLDIASYGLLAALRQPSGYVLRSEFIRCAVSFGEALCDGVPTTW